MQVCLTEGFFFISLHMIIMQILRILGSYQIHFNIDQVQDPFFGFQGEIGKTSAQEIMVAKALAPSIRHSKAER